MAVNRNRCKHCGSSALHAACVVCNRDMCEDCISYGDAGKMCGMCIDREDSLHRYRQYVKVVGVNPLSFDEWYDKHG